MKLFLLFSLISFSSLSFADENTSKDDVIQAIKDSIASKDLDCILTNAHKSYKASELNLDSLKENDFVMTIDESEQPVITFTRLTNSHEGIVTIKTNSDLTIVEGIKSIFYTIKKVKVNTGTITRPRFEEKIVKTFDSSLECN